jgi:hypothetical protein
MLPEKKVRQRLNLSMKPEVKQWYEEKAKELNYTSNELINHVLEDTMKTAERFIEEYNVRQKK